MARVKSRIPSVRLSLDTGRQDADLIHKLVDRMLGEAGCTRCGRITRLGFDFVVDPPAALERLGVTSISVLGR